MGLFTLLNGQGDKRTDALTLDGWELDAIKTATDNNAVERKNHARGVAITEVFKKCLALGLEVLMVTEPESPVAYHLDKVTSVEMDGLTVYIAKK